MGLVRQMEENADDLDFLDNYIEAHIHGALKMWEDVDAIVLDPCYERTEIEASANNLGCKVEWHSGFQMRRQYLVDCVGYRGADVAALAESMLETSLLTPRAIGLLRKGGQVDPQMLKLIWHCVAKFGRL